MKKSFTLFSTLILVFLFSLVCIKIYELKSISSINIINQYKYIQAKNHLNFLEEYINTLNDFETLKKIQIKNEKFDILALIHKQSNKTYEIELIVKALNFNVRVYKKILKVSFKE